MDVDSTNTCVPGLTASRHTFEGRRVVPMQGRPL